MTVSEAVTYDAFCLICNAMETCYHSRRPPHLTSRELGIVRVLPDPNLDNLAAVASTVNLTVKSLKTHLLRIYRKINCHDLQALRLWAVEHAVELGAVTTSTVTKRTFGS